MSAGTGWVMMESARSVEKRDKMKSNPKIAVYMSCYNHEKYVRMAVDSVLQQTYSNLEFFIVNDGSTDGSGRILESYTDERIHYFDFKKNTRLVGASNFLMKKMKEQDADYIACIASDDMWEKDKLEKQVSFLLSHPEYRACFTWDRLEYSEDWDGRKVVGEKYSHKKNKSRFDWLHFFYFYGNCMNACSMLMEKEIFYEIGGMNQNYYALADYRAWMLLVEKYPFYLMESELTIYRRHGTNLSNHSIEGKIRNINELYKVYQEVMISMDKDTFRRTFYRELIYEQCDSPEELLAEKFIILLNHFKRLGYIQIAMDIYYDNCENESFVSILEKQYFFDSVDFINLTGNQGMALSANVICDEDIVPWSVEKIKRCTPGIVLLSAIDDKRISEETLSNYRYSTLLDLYAESLRYEGGERQFQQIRRWIGQVRNIRSCKTERKVLFIVAGDWTGDLSGIMAELKIEKEDDCAVAFVYKKEHYFTDTLVQPDGRLLPEGMRCISLYNEVEHCLYFLEELGETADVIYYVDCLGQEYECEDMLAGYPLHIQCNCILSTDLYEKLVQQKARSLSIMEEIYTI